VLQPYYSDESVQIYNADAREVLPAIPAAKVSLLLTDPPYGVNYTPWGGGRRSRYWKVRVNGDAEPFDPTPLLRFPRLVIFGGNNYAHLLPDAGAGWIVWDKTPNYMRDGWMMSHCELAWTNATRRVVKVPLQYGGEATAGEDNYHPTQKPVALMAAILRLFTKPGDLVLDPYMGAGPVLRAAKDLGRRAVGIEIERSYCDTAVERLQQSVLPLAHTWP
jgi:site-specific DNA-methyltransferase (adenine-specific)